MSSAMKHFEQQSYYELLEIPPTASEEQILDAYARAMETYSPDSIAVYSLADPGQLESLRQQLTRAMETLSELDKRLEYDRSIGMTRSADEVARLRAEGLKRVAEASPGPKEVPAVEAPPPVAPPRPAETVEAIEVVETVEAAEVVPEAEPRPVSAPPTATSVEAVPEPVAAAPAEAPVPVRPEAVPEPVAAAPVAPPATSGLPRGVSRHARPLAPTSRPGSVVPPPLPVRNALRTPLRSAAEAHRRPESEAANGTPPPSAQEKGRVPHRPSAGQSLGEAPVLAQASAIATAESALAQVAGKARDSRTRLKTVVDIPSDAEFNGELLRQIREGRGLTPQMLADRTRISSRHVENIEADRYDGLPAAVYLRGMLMSIARELGLDPLRVSRSYMTLVSAGEKKRR